LGGDSRRHWEPALVWEGRPARRPPVPLLPAAGLFPPATPCREHRRKARSASAFRRVRSAGFPPSRTLEIYAGRAGRIKLSAPAAGFFPPPPRATFASRRRVHKRPIQWV